MNVKAIPTEYSGVQFRSRLEARVAAALDWMDIAWEYEPEAFTLSDGTNYLPDFRIGGTWVEVKPGNPWRDRSADLKIGKMAESDPSLKCFLVYPDETDTDLRRILPRWTLGLVGVRGIGYRSSAVWTRCPSCGAGLPWSIGDCSPAACCGKVVNDVSIWWDGHYLSRTREEVPGSSVVTDYVWPELPQWKDGRAISTHK